MVILSLLTRCCNYHKTLHILRLSPIITDHCSTGDYVAHSCWVLTFSTYEIGQGLVAPVLLLRSNSSPSLLLNFLKPNDVFCIYTIHTCPCPTYIKVVRSPPPPPITYSGPSLYMQADPGLICRTGTACAAVYLDIFPQRKTTVGQLTLFPFSTNWARSKIT